MPTYDTRVAEFKQRVAAEWGNAETAAAWQRHYPAMKEQLASVTEALVDAAAPQPGMRVLDLASGPGDPALALARKVAPGGTVTATDLNPHMLEALRSNAAAEGLSNVETQDCDAHELPFQDDSFDLVTSRFGVMFCGELDRALSGIRRVLRPGGRIAFLVWGAPAAGTYFGATALPFIKRLAEKPDPDGPGPMRFAEPGKLARFVKAAGFLGVEERISTLATPFTGSPRELLDRMFEIAAPLRNLISTLSESDRRAAEGEALAELSALERDGLVHISSPVIIVSAVSKSAA